MQFDSLSDFLHMGGYAFFVWWSYAIAVVLLAWNIIAPRWHLRRLRERLAREGRLAGSDDSAPARSSLVSEHTR